jgi:ATP-dependent RNA helicase RhlB
VQIHKDAETARQTYGLQAGLVYGGTGYQQQRDQIAAGVDILIGTPGRFIDYYKQRVFDFNSVQVMVLDEADRMFDLGFIKDIRFVLRRLPSPAERLGMLFSATLSYRVTELAYEHMNDPQMVEIAPEQVTADRVQQTCYMVANDEKIPLLLGWFAAWRTAASWCSSTPSARASGSGVICRATASRRRCSPATCRKEAPEAALAVHRGGEIR